VSYIMGQVNVINTTAPIFTVPPGLCNITFWNVSGTNVYVGTSTTASTVNGLQCHSIPTSFFTYVGSRGATFYGANPTSGTATVNYILTTDA
jgi:hypothetical protein